MYALDFDYDGKRLSDFGCIICDFDDTTGLDFISVGSQITFNTVQRNQGKISSLTSAKYDSAIQSTFDICKDPKLCKVYADKEFTDSECRDIIRWLNRREFKKLTILDDSDDIMDSRHFYASFNVERIEIAKKVYGLRLTVETNSPFAFGETVRREFQFSSPTKGEKLIDISDEIGFIYPNLIINCLGNGDLKLTNETTNCNFYVKSCTTGEVITVNGDARIISTNKDGHDISGDFNYDFFNIQNTIDDRNNIIKASIPCKVMIEYEPIIKASL